MTRTRTNGEGSIFPYRNGFAAYVWVTKPDGKRTRKYVYGKTRDEVHDKWIALQGKARKGPIATKAMTVRKFATYWMTEIVEPNLSPGTYATYEVAVRLYIVPGLGDRRLDRLNTPVVQMWLNTVARTCRCCTQGKDARRREEKRRCCSKGECCNAIPSSPLIRQLRRILRAMLTCAIEADHITDNPAVRIKLPPLRKSRGKSWSSDEARRFLEHVRVNDSRFYAAYVLILVLGLRKGEVLGMSWDQIDFDIAEVVPRFQLQRIGRNLLRRAVKTETSEDPLPLPDICIAALKHHRENVAANEGYPPDSGDLLFRTVTGRPVEPRNFNRFMDRQIKTVGVPRITVHDARRTRGTLLADLDIHPRVAMRILRHAQFSITMEVYTQVSSEKTRKALQRLGESLQT
ncbi:MAG: tyrosine-type recombinase/integrase [Mycobacteriales bacterium]